MKFMMLLRRLPHILSSRPVWGAWIEIRMYDAVQALIGVSRPVWGAWIEISIWGPHTQQQPSRPVWGAWIEIVYAALGLGRAEVAPRMGRVD